LVTGQSFGFHAVPMQTPLARSGKPFAMIPALLPDTLTEHVEIVASQSLSEHL